MDSSHLDKKYFVDPHKYNCPFCKRGHVSYELKGTEIFNWSNSKDCYVYFVKCNSCGKESIHFSYDDLREYEYSQNLYGPSKRWPTNHFSSSYDLDKKIFFSQPSSFFILDNRIPEKIRELIHEAEKSRQANFLVGSTACLRKAIYELLEHEKTIIRDKKTNRANYKESIKSLKDKFPFVAPDYFDAMGDIQEMASDNVHEGSWEAWDSIKIKFILELLKGVLGEMYVIPDERKKTLGVLSQLKSTFVSDAKKDKNGGDTKNAKT